MARHALTDAARPAPRSSAVPRGVRLRRTPRPADVAAVRRLAAAVGVFSSIIVAFNPKPVNNRAYNPPLESAVYAERKLEQG